MNIINSLLRQHKGLSSFLFVFIFLYSGIIRGIITFDDEDFIPHYAHNDSDSESNFSTQLNHFNNVSIVNQFKEKSESEIDEVHFDIEIYFSSHAPLQFLPYLKYLTSKGLSWFNNFKLHLYDLYCTWKFHLI
jgi:hypothetical protein